MRVPAYVGDDRDSGHVIDAPLESGVRAPGFGTTSASQSKPTGVAFRIGGKPQALPQDEKKGQLPRRSFA
jgi:hypothetical protein